MLRIEFMAPAWAQELCQLTQCRSALTDRPRQRVGSLYAVEGGAGGGLLLSSIAHQPWSDKQLYRYQIEGMERLFLISYKPPHS